MCVFFGLWGFGPALAHRVIGGSVRAAFEAQLPWLSSLLLEALRLASVLAAAWFAARFVDRRPFSHYGFRIHRTWWLDLGFGVLLGALLMGTIFAISLAAGWVQVVDVLVAPAGTPFGGMFVSAIFLYVVVAIAEELLARGNQLLNMTEGFRPLGRWQAVMLAWLISSVIFGALHILNPNATGRSIAYLAWYGVLLGAGFVFTGELALPIGLHFSWNFVQGSIFGFAVSGRSLLGVSVLSTVETGPEFWTGGAFGPEGGLLGVLAAAAGILLIIGWVRWRTGSLALSNLYANTFVAQVTCTQASASTPEENTKQE
ncbi:MAG: CPBP family intramembrane metalloprotease [Anaerolineales bacterium]|nr:CPBP family intramembrane metalloprotease [Anaerolineales bacterium]